MKGLPTDINVRVYAVGGDGILFDCLNGIINLCNTELAVVPYGRCNDFVRAFGENLEETFRNISLQAASDSVATDVIFCGSNYALNTCSIGAESDIVSNTIKFNSHMKKLYAIIPPTLGRRLYNFSYTFVAISTFFDRNIMRQEYQVSLDGVDYSGVYAAINIGNGPCYGGKRCATVAAMPNDGLLDVLLTRQLTTLKAYTIGNSIANGNYKKYPKYTLYRRTKTLSIYSERTLTIQLDGELFFDKHIYISVVPNAVRIVAPSNVKYKKRAVYNE
jgi:diacylglycerol kinase family enzyme